MTLPSKTDRQIATGMTSSANSHLQGRGSITCTGEWRTRHHLDGDDYSQADRGSNSGVHM